MIPESYRRLFPVTLQKIYLNHAAISPLSTRVTDRLDWYLDERQFGTIDTYYQVREIRDETRRNIAAMIKAAPESIAFIGNTSEGFNHLVNGLTWQPGDQIILTDYEFPSNVYPFMNLQRLGVELVFVKNREGRIEIEDIRQAITSRTRLLSISYVEFSNGFRNDLQAIGRICQEQGIIFSVDSIQGLGGLPLDVQQCRIDFLSNGGHKWLMGLMGAGFMYIAPRLFERLVPACTGWLAVEEAWDFFNYELKLLPDARRFEYATANFMGVCALNESTKLLLEVGLANIEQHLLRLGRRMVDGLAELGMTFRGADDEKYWSGIYSFAGRDTAQLFEHLQNKQIICSLRNGLLRVAPHFYNTQDEIDELMAEVKTFYEHR